ncbi:MAG: class I SAM-dependent methyltransferase [Lachnospiraceae bacterium]|nr:class I SAM-dependent methyltransferase [Lachnospiraceae bacterium]
MESRETILSENCSYWSQRAPSYSELNQEELRSESRLRWQTLLEERILGHFPGKSREEIHILEVGTGPGFFAILLAGLGYSVTAVDLTPNMLAEAKKNAGNLASSINFLQMNAEELRFPDESFDVLLSRNLTWNLPHPETACREWYRVLKRNGLLLNFDANWYAYLFDEQERLSYESDRRRTSELGIRDRNVGTNFDVMEDIAHRIPLSGISRPQWDVNLLSSLGMAVSSDTNVWQYVWSDEEKINFASTPLFMVEAKKIPLVQA